MFSKRITVTVGGLTDAITRRHGLFMGEITTHTGATCTSDLFRLPSENENSNGASLYLAPSEAFLSKLEHEGEVAIDWSYQKFTPRIWRKGFRCASLAMILSAIGQNPEALAGGKVLFPLERGFRLFRGNSVTSCVLVWDGSAECGEGVIASISPNKSDLMDGLGVTSVGQLNGYNRIALNGYWPKKKGPDPLIKHLSFVPIDEYTLDRVRVAVVRRRC